MISRPSLHSVVTLPVHEFGQWSSRSTLASNQQLYGREGRGMNGSSCAGARSLTMHSSQNWHSHTGIWIVGWQSLQFLKRRLEMWTFVSVLKSEWILHVLVCLETGSHVSQVIFHLWSWLWASGLSECCIWIEAWEADHSWFVCIRDPTLGFRSTRQALYQLGYTYVYGLQPSSRFQHKKPCV